MESLPAVAISIIYPEPLSLVLALLIVFIFVLVGPGVLMGLLGSDRWVMGGYVSNRAWKVAYWVSLAAVLSFGLIAVASAV